MSRGSRTSAQPPDERGQLLRLHEPLSTARCRRRICHALLAQPTRKRERIDPLPLRVRSLPHPARRISRDQRLLFLSVRNPPTPLVVLGDFERLDHGGGFHPPRLSGFTAAD